MAKEKLSTETKPSELEKRLAIEDIALEVAKHYSGYPKDNAAMLADATKAIEAYVAPLRAALAASQAECDQLRKAIVTPDDLEGGEIVHAGTYDCPCGCDPDTNHNFIDKDGMSKVTHLKCRACGRLKPFWDGADIMKQVADNAALRQQVETLRKAGDDAKTALYDGMYGGDEEYARLSQAYALSAVRGLEAALSAQPAAEPTVA